MVEERDCLISYGMACLYAMTTGLIAALMQRLEATDEFTAWLSVIASAAFWIFYLQTALDDGRRLEEYET